MKMNNESHDHKKCLELFEKLSEYIDCELDDVTCRDVEEHICQCKPCKTCLETLKKTVEICKNLDERPVPEIFSKKLRILIQGLS